MKIQSLNVVFFAICTMASGLVSASEVSLVRDRLQALQYPIPVATILDLHEIEAELTPLPVAEKSIAAPNKEGWFCDKQLVRIPYQLDRESPVKYFEAKVVRPSKLLKALKFSKVSSHPAIVIQPTLAGPTVLEKMIAFHSCLDGFVSIVPTDTALDLPEKLPDFKAYDRNMRLEIIKARRMVDFLETNADVDSRKVGAIGFSRGAIAGSLLMGVEPRIRYAFFGGGGAGVAQIIANSKTERGQKDTARHMKAAGMNLKEFEAALFATLRYDGILFSHRIRPHRVKLMIVNEDESVATKNQELLRSSLGHPVTIYRNEGHVQSILDQALKGRAEFLEFFKEQARSL